MSTTEPTYRIWSNRWLWIGQTVVGLFLVGLAGFSLRAYSLDDGRGGWAMYSHNVQFIVTYEFVFADGRREPYFPGKEIQGRASHLKARTPKSLDTFPVSNTRYGLGALQSWIRGYVDYLYRHKRPEGATEIVATLRYAVNKPLVVSDEIPYPDSVLRMTRFFSPSLDDEPNQTVVQIRRTSELRETKKKN